jgi:hypothetical protein
MPPSTKSSSNDNADAYTGPALLKRLDLLEKRRMLDLAYSQSPSTTDTEIQ